MALLGIPACKILQDEIVWLLANDPDVDNIVVTASNNIREFVEKLDEQQLSYDVIPFEKLTTALRNYDQDQFTVVVDLLELGLHEFPKKLRSTVYERIGQMTSLFDGILIFYGLCGNVLGNAEEELGTDDCIVRILKDNEQNIVDDCIGATVGGGTQYRELLKTHAKQPAFFFTPMYANSWKEFFDFERYDPDPGKALEMAKMVNDCAGYSRVAKVSTGLEYVKDIDAKIKEFADLFGYTTFEVPGNQDIFRDCYFSIKNEIFDKR